VVYLDTSVLGALFFREPTAPAILPIWKPLISPWVRSGTKRIVRD
jgi:hypothetical protein